MRKTIEDLGILQIGVNYIFENKGLAKSLMGQLLSQPYSWHKSILHWQCNNLNTEWKLVTKHNINEQQKHRGWKRCLCRAWVECALWRVKDTTEKEARHINIKKWNEHVNEESTDIVAGEQEIFVFFSKWKRWKRLQVFRNFRPKFATNIH